MIKNRGWPSHHSGFFHRRVFLLHNLKLSEVFDVFGRNYFIIQFIKFYIFIREKMGNECQACDNVNT